MGGAGVEPALPPHQRGALPLSYPPASGRGWDRTSGLLFVREALSLLSYTPIEWTGRESNPRTTASFATATTTARLFCRALSDPAQISTQKSGSRSRTSISTFRAWCPALRRSRSVRAPTAVAPIRQSRTRPAVAAPLRPSPQWGIDAAGERLGGASPCRLSRPPEGERCFPCHSPTLRPWIANRRLRTFAVVGVLRGGALEPEPRARLRKWAG